MKKLALLLLAFSMLSCEAGMNILGSLSNTGSVTVSLPGGQRSLPTLDQVELYQGTIRGIDIAYTEIKTGLPGSDMSFRSLIPGSYEIALEALNASDEMVFDGSTTVNVRAGETAEAFIQLEASTGDVTVTVQGPVYNVTLGFYATITEQFINEFGHAPGLPAVGDRVEGYINYNLMTVDSNPDSELGEYLHTEQNYGIAVGMGGFWYYNDVIDPVFRIQINNDQNGADQLVFNMETGDSNNDDVDLENMYMSVTDESAQAVNSDDLFQGILEIGPQDVSSDFLYINGTNLATTEAENHWCFQISDFEFFVP